MDTGLLLASQSARRRELLRLLGLPFHHHAPQVDESRRPGESPPELVLRLAVAKAGVVPLPADRSAPTAIIACDTIVALGDEVLGKPHNPAAARQMLRRLRGRSHLVYSGIALHDPATGKTETDLVATTVWMREYTDAEIETYVAGGDPFDKAGSYAIQNTTFHPVAAIEGCYANVMGLPLCHLARLLREQGIVVPADVPAACRAYTGRKCTISPED